MNNILFLHLSLEIPNQIGLPQYMMELFGDKTFLQHQLELMARSKKTTQIIILISGALSDDCIVSLVKKLPSSLSKSITVFRIESGKEGAFDKDNFERISIAPDLVRAEFGAYNLECFFSLGKKFEFDRAMLLWSGHSPFMTGEVLDELWDLAGMKSTLIASPVKYIPIIIASYEEIKVMTQELKSERSQEYLYKFNSLQKRKASSLQISCLQKEIQYSSFLDISHKLNFTRWKGNALWNPFFPLLNAFDLKWMCHILAESEKIFSDASPLRYAASPEGRASKKEIYRLLEERVKEMERTSVLLNLEVVTPDFGFLTPELLREYLKLFSIPPPLVLLGMNIEPLSYPGIEAILRVLKNEGVFTVGMRITELEKFLEFLERARDDFPDFVILALNPESYNQKCFEKIIFQKHSQKIFKNLLMFVEIQQNKGSQKTIKSFMDSYLYLVNEIILEPPQYPKAGGFCLPALENSQVCLWSHGNTYINSHGNLQLCEKASTCELPVSSENILKIRTLQGKEGVCENCIYKQRSHGLETQRWKHGVFQRENPVEQWIFDGLMPRLKPEWEDLFKTHPMKEFLNILRSLEQEKYTIFRILNHELFQSSVEVLFQQERFHDILDLVEFILSRDLVHPLGRESLERILRTIREQEEKISVSPSE